MRLPVIKNKLCENVFKPKEGPGSIKDSMVCAGYVDESGKGGCFADSGGPLVCNVDGKAVLTGVVSWGSEICASLPTVFARVTHVLFWIKNNLVSLHVCLFV